MSIESTSDLARHARCATLPGATGTTVAGASNLILASSLAVPVGTLALDPKLGVSADPSFVAPARHDRGLPPLAASFPPSGMAGSRDPGACELLFALMRNGAGAGAVSRAEFE
jgi:hypothetical protein